MSTRVDRKPRGRRKVGMLLQRNRLVEMVLRKRGEGGGRGRRNISKQNMLLAARNQEGGRRRRRWRRRGIRREGERRRSPYLTDILIHLLV